MSDFVSEFWNIYVIVITAGSVLACALILYMQSKATFTPGKTMGHDRDFCNCLFYSLPGYG